MDAEELQREFAKLKEEMLSQFEKEIEEIKATFKKDLDELLPEKKGDNTNEVFNQTTHNTITKTHNYKVVDGEVVTDETKISYSDIDGKKLSEQIQKNVWEQIRKAQNKNDQN